jgi:hypothetical protein
MMSKQLLGRLVVACALLAILRSERAEAAPIPLCPISWGWYLNEDCDNQSQVQLHNFCEHELLENHPDWYELCAVSYDNDCGPDPANQTHYGTFCYFQDLS